VPAQVVATYAALADYANNQTGLCWPRMDTLARTLKRTPRTIQSHLHILKERGLIEFVERRRDRKGRFLSWVYRIAHVAAAAERIRERREKNKAAYQERKRKQQEEREPVDATLAEAVSAGARIIQPAEDVVFGRRGYFADPEGHLWEVAWNPAFPMAEDGTIRLPN
jgi:DNA-binding transcriptional ArsR family regulator